MESLETSYDDTSSHETDASGSQQADVSDSQPGDASGSSTDDASKDASDKVEKLIAAIPIVVYCGVFYARLKIYQWLGLPHTLVSIKTDDLLLIGMAMIALSWSANWLVTNLFNPQDEDKRFLKFIGWAQLIVLAAQAFMMARMSIAHQVFNTYQYAMLGLEALILLVWYLAMRQRWVFADHGEKLLKASLVACTALFAVLAVERAAYLAYHNAEYQYCPEDNALIIDYSSGGYAIEKGIVSLNDDGACVLTGGYVLRNVEGKQLRVVRLSYIDVEVNEG